MFLVSGKRGRGRPRKRPPFSGPNLSCSVLGCEMTSSVAASFDDEKSGKQRAAVFPFPEGDDNLALGKRYVESVLHAIFLVWDTVEILISSHFVHTDRHSDKRTHYNVPKF